MYLDPVALANGEGRKNVEEAIENLRGRLRGTRCKSLAHEFTSRRSSNAASACLGDRSKSADGQRHTENAEIVVVCLIAQTGVADLVESSELVEADGITVGHDEAVEDNGKPRLARVL